MFKHYQISLLEKHSVSLHLTKSKQNLCYKNIYLSHDTELRDEIWNDKGETAF